MKFRKFLGMLLLYLGGIMALAALLALLAPHLENGQVRLILSSFEAPGPDAVVNALNQALLFVLHNSVLVLCIGAGTLLLSLPLLWNPNRGDPDAVGAASGSGLYAVPPGHAEAGSAPSATEWRRPGPKPASPSGAASSHGPGKKAPKANPYRSYGQSAYAPPAKAQRPSKAPAAAVLESAYQRPPTATPVEKSVPAEAAYYREGRASAQEEWDPPVPVAFSSPRPQTIPEPMKVSLSFRKPGNSAQQRGTSGPPSAARIRSTMRPAREPQADAEDAPLMAVSPERQASVRIRSTMGKKKE